MSNTKSNKNRDGVVYSTNPDFEFQSIFDESEIETLEISKQKLVLKLDTKSRAGKSVTVIDGFIGKEEDLKMLSQSLKTSLSVGGTIKDGQIIMQGDLREKLLLKLQKDGYKVRKM